MYHTIRRSKGRIAVVDDRGKEHGVFATPFHAKLHIQKLVKERAPTPAPGNTKGMTHGG